MTYFDFTSSHEEVNEAILAARHSPYFPWLGDTHQAALRTGEGGPKAQIEALNAWCALKRDEAIKALVKLNHERVRVFVRYQSHLPRLTPEEFTFLQRRIPIKPTAERVNAVRAAITRLKELSAEKPPSGKKMSARARERREENRARARAKGAGSKTSGFTGSHR